MIQALSELVDLVIKVWSKFLDSLDTTGGHIVVLIFLIIIAAIAFRHGFPKAEDLGNEAFGATLYALKGVKDNLEKGK